MDYQEAYIAMKTEGKTFTRRKYRGSIVFFFQNEALHAKKLNKGILEVTRIGSLNMSEKDTKANDWIEV